MFNPIRIAARGLLASVFIGGGLNQLKAPAAIAPAVEAAEQQYGISLPVAAKDLVTFNGAAMVAGGAALALGIKPRTVATGLVASLVPTTISATPSGRSKTRTRSSSSRTASSPMPPSSAACCWSP